MPSCPACGERGVPPAGPKNAEILIIGEFPGESEMEHLRPFCGASGKVLKAEMRKAGLEFASCRVTNIWLHEPNEEQDCFQAGLDIALSEAKGRKAVLLIGSECAKVFLEQNVSDVCGLRVKSAVLSAPLVMAMVNPAIVFQPNKGIGEVRMALRKFAAACKDDGIEIKDLDDDEDANPTVYFRRQPIFDEYGSLIGSTDHGENYG